LPAAGRDLRLACAGLTNFTGEKTPAPASTADILAAHDAGVKAVKDA
jgi:hypothetical protein